VSYRDYQKTIGLELAELPDDITTKDFKYDEPDNMWFGTIYVKAGVPHAIAFYIWKCSQENQKRCFDEQLAEFDGEWEMHGINGGNGHYSALLRRKES
jgi:hypothetical protein